ncbi:hypothetical protein HCN44_003160 [Aphidius gifuensis]|uniref:HRDC domain-containing protein n=1 Tax=Aphidius gifuensis TaxID=684658 RepID=A0A834XJP9_APHGI|nr:hypothetical protein HCN44_003160 [Aphidius gifuensis]
MERKKPEDNPEDNSMTMEVQKDILPGYATFDDYSKDAFAAIKAGIKAANSLPTGENFNFWACIPKFNNDRNKEMKNIMDTMQKIIKCSGAAGSICQRDNDEKFDLLAETNDIFLDRANIYKILVQNLIDGENGEIFSHPYEFELDKFNVNEKYLVKCKPIKYKSLDDTPMIMIEKQNDLKIMLNDLLRYDEIAIDLEHHSYRTYQGITCLMQISTRDTDYLIDTLSLRSELHVLNEIFTKPTVLKVFHGADCDIQWLQRDLSLYIVNMFDTHQAAKHLNLPYLSLAYLLKTHCNVDPNKHFQLADWRMRPLLDELMKYAREDTHYLLYIKDILNNQLIDFANGQTNILKAVYDRSTEVCKKLYEKPVCNDDSFMSLYRKSRKMFNTRQLHALKEIFNWRDKIARQEDDSTGYVLPNHMLLNIAETLPREMQGILACCNPIPPLIRQHQLALHKIVLEARAKPLIKPILEQDIRQRLNQRNHTMEAGQESVTVWSSCDIPSGGIEIQENLPCLLDEAKNNEDLKKLDVQKIDHVVTIFDSPTNSDNEDDLSSKIKLQNARKTFVSPFERYKLVIPMVAAQEAKDRAIKEKQLKEKAEAIKASTNQTADSINRVREHFIQVTQNTMKTPDIKNTKADRFNNYSKDLSTSVSPMVSNNNKRKRPTDSVDRSNNPKNNQQTPNGNKKKNYGHKASPGLRQFSETGCFPEHFQFASLYRTEGSF